MHRNRKQGGFTLIELIVTTIVLAIVVAVGLPSFMTLIQNNRIATETNKVITAINLARSEAIKRGVNVTLCASSDQQTCASNNWSDGWIVFVDNDTPATAVPGGAAPTAPAANPTAAELIQVWPAMEGGMTLTGGTDFIRYKPDGMADLSAEVTLNLDIPDCTGNQQRAIRVSVTGRPSVTHEACQ